MAKQANVRCRVRDDSTFIALSSLELESQYHDDIPVRIVQDKLLAAPVSSPRQIDANPFALYLLVGLLKVLRLKDNRYVARSGPPPRLCSSQTQTYGSPSALRSCQPS